MHDTEQDPFDVYLAVINHEEQYSIWPADLTMPKGWREAGKRGSKQECLDYIEVVWTDMRPLSLRKKMETPPPVGISKVEDMGKEISLVDRLCAGPQQISARLHPKCTPEALKDRIEMGYIHILFSETKGGTELGIRLVPEKCNLENARFGDA